MDTKFAVIETGGKQYKVSEGDVIKIERLSGENKEGDKITFDKVLLVDDSKNTKVGTPYIDKAEVEGSFVEEGKDKKVHIIKFKSKSNYSKKTGHRQVYNLVKIEKIA